MTPEEEERWVASIKAENDETALEKLKRFQRPKTQAFFQAPSGHRLHLRILLPSDDLEARQVKAVIVHCHGLNSHVNGGHWAGEFLPRLAREGFAVFGVDIMGHGYSEGTRALIQDWHHVFADLEALAEAIFDVGDEPVRAEVFNANMAPEILGRLRQRPLFIHGASMGGMICFHLGMRLQRHPRLQKIFKGATLGCPALQVPMPPEAVVCFLNAFVVPCFSHSGMPSILSSSSKINYGHSYVLSDPKQKMYAEMEMRDDPLRFPDVGLGWTRNTRWGTAGAFAKVFSSMDKDMTNAKFPFLIIHDPKDKITFFEGSEKLMERSPSNDKELRRFDTGGFHCICFIDLEGYVGVQSSWMNQRLA